MLIKRYYDDVTPAKRNSIDSIFDDYSRAWDLFTAPNPYLTIDNFYRTEKSENGLSLSVDLPGVKPEDLSVTLEGRTLKIKGTQRGKQLSYSYLISKEYDAGNVDAQLENGVLTLTFNKAPELEPKKVEIKVVA